MGTLVSPNSKPAGCAERSSKGSSIAMLNRIGESGSPCLTPLAMSMGPVDFPPAVILIEQPPEGIRYVVNDLLQATASQALVMTQCGTVSNAVLRSSAVTWYGAASARRCFTMACKSIVLARVPSMFLKRLRTG